jgi:hypothetical protein
MRQEEIERYREEMKQSMLELSKNGYKCYMVDRDGFLYGFMVTPSDNVLYVQRNEWAYRGWDFAFEYVPSKENGTGCGCLEDPTPDMSIETVQRAEKEGNGFASRLHATRYKNSEAWLKSYWKKEDLIPVTAE